MARFVSSRIKADFETEYRHRDIILRELPPKSPELDEHNNGTWRYEFYATWDLPDDPKELSRWLDAFAEEFNTSRPCQAFGGMTPTEYLATRTANEPSPYLMWSNRTSS